MEVTVNLSVLFGVIFGILGSVVCIALVSAIIKLNENLKQVKSILEKNDKNITEALETLPKVLHNLGEITGGVNQEMKHIQSTIQNIGETVELTATAAHTVNEDIINPISDLFAILNFLRGIFPKEKKKSWLGK